MNRRAAEGFYDPAERRREKDRSRQRDVADLASGRKSPADLQRENGSFAFPQVEIDFDGAESLV